MQILSYADGELDFLTDAYLNILYGDNIKTLDNLVEGMSLSIARYQKFDHIMHTYEPAYDMLLQKNKENICAVRLIEKQHEGQTVFEPHSYTNYDYRGNAYAYRIYSWLLDNGFTLLSCGRQTSASRGLWQKLAQKYNFRLFNQGLKKYMDHANFEDFAVVSVLQPVFAKPESSVIPFPGMAK